MQAAGRTSGAQRTPLAVVKDYFVTLDADLKSADFSNLGNAYAPDATLKVTDVHGAADEYHGLTAIKGYWQHRGIQVPGLHFTPDRIVALDALHVAAFERTGTNQEVLAGRCAHLFKVRGGKIVFDAYFGIAFTKSERAQLK
jgi:ketosteroid isomerase-like protein